MTFVSREHYLQNFEANSSFDIIIIGGGATGLGCAIDAVTRGYKTLLIEGCDFAKGTSSKSTKLVHGGVRYLEQGDIKLVREALKERGLLLKNAAHVAHPLEFVIPVYKWWQKYYYGIGLKVYDLLSGKYSIGKSTLLNKQKVLEKLPNVKSEKLSGGVSYFDGQFDDAQLTINMFQTFVRNGGVAINYCHFTNFIKSTNGKITGVTFYDVLEKKNYTASAKVVINATGVFADEIMQKDNPQLPKMILPSQGIHIMLPLDFLPTKSALMIPKTTDGRVLFGIPWHDKLLVGTTDTPVNEISLEPRALEEEINFILQNTEAYLAKKPKREDILSVFAGLRPLFSNTNKVATKKVSRSHHLEIFTSGLVNILGGKWTTYRKMAEDAINAASKEAGLQSVACQTENLSLIGWEDDKKSWKSRIIAERPNLAELIHPNYKYNFADVLWSIEFEMARTVEDILARRIRILFFNAADAAYIAPKMAQFMANELQKDQVWEKEQIDAFKAVLENYNIASKT